MSVRDPIVELGHRPEVPPRIGAAPQPLDTDIRAAFAEIPVTDIADAVGPLYTLDPEIRPIYEPMNRLVGLARTVKAPYGDNLAIHAALSEIRAGDVLVIDWRQCTRYCGSGANSLLLPVERGLAGVVIDGGWRDAGELQDAQIPVFARSISASSPPKNRLGEIDVPVACGGVVVSPGDVVVADREGIAVVPSWALERVIDRLQARQGKAPVDANEKRAQLQKSAAARRSYFERRFAEMGGITDSATQSEA